MYYRRKVLLAIIQAFDRAIHRTDMQKYLFLFTQQQEKPAYDFVPYKFGCFSFQSYADKRTLMKYGILTNQEDWKKNDDVDYISTLRPNEKKILLWLIKSFGDLQGKDLIRRIYVDYPYYAINSEIVDEILTAEEIKEVKKQIPSQQKPEILSIGYEGKSFDHYLNQLIQNNIQLLIDVRKNAFSMKYGFSKNQFRDALEKLGIEYLHLPELGIISGKRNQLNTYDDYLKLFHDYERTVLKDEKESLKKILRLLTSKNRIAITCFERDHNYCHRNRVINRIADISSDAFNISYL